VPNVVGLTRDEAKAALEEAGFRFDYNTSWDLFPDVVTEVEAQEPEAESQHTKGTVVSMRIRAVL
jgi:beta-lactam-binding protein with PASTA domain